MDEIVVMRLVGGLLGTLPGMAPLNSLRARLRVVNLAKEVTAAMVPRTLLEHLSGPNKIPPLPYRELPAQPLARYLLWGIRNYRCCTPQPHPRTDPTIALQRGSAGRSTAFHGGALGGIVQQRERERMAPIML